MAAHRWMADGRHYRVRVVAPNVDNIHLRIANDVYLFIQRTHELTTGLLGSIVALASFAYILWGLSAVTPMPGEVLLCPIIVGPKSRPSCGWPKLG